MAVEDLASNPIIRVSMGTNIPPPPTPPTLPTAAPKKPTIDPMTILHPNFISCATNQIRQLNHQIILQTASETVKQSKVFRYILFDSKEAINK